MLPSKMFEEILSVLNAPQIFELIKIGQINTADTLTAAYNSIVNKIVFENESGFDTEMFNELESFVKTRVQHDNSEMERSRTRVPASTLATSEYQAMVGAGTSKVQYPLAGVRDDSTPSTSQNYPMIRLGTVPTDNGAPRQSKKYFTIESEGARTIKKFNLAAKTLVFTFNDADTTENPLLWLKKAFDEIIAHVTTGADASDRIGMILRNYNFPEKPICFSFRRLDQLSSAAILATLEKILQSNASFFAKDTMRLHIDRVVLPVGTGPSRLKLTGVDFKEYCSRKEGIIVVVNEDNYCLARALVLALAWRRNDENLMALENGGALMRRATFDLCESANVDLIHGGTYEHIHQFQQYLTGFTIVVYNDRNGKSVYYEGPRASDRVVLNLLFENGHYNVITNFTSAFACRYFCELCRIRFSNKNGHKKCKYTCPCCHSTPPCNSWLELIKCNICHRDFHGPQCFATHTTQLCMSLQRCLTCLASVWKDANKPHRCGYKYCQACKGDKPIRHLCYMSKNVLANKKLMSKFIFVFYDFETMQETLVEGAANTYLHEPNLCVAQNVCKSCVDDPDITRDCGVCGKRQHVFTESPVQKFLKYVAKLASNGTYVTALAHNMKGFDGIFILRELIKNQATWNPKIISTGSKIMSITCNSIKFIDSLNFMAMPLSKLPETFKFTASKGYFPYLFNTRDNKNYVGRLPDLKYYCPDEMSSKNRNSFLKWHAEERERNVVFDMQQEIVKYCVSDVDILRRACLDFWKLFLEQNRVDPFRETCTIAGACMLVFRRNFLEDGTIGLIPRRGYRMADNQSVIGIKWLLWVAHDTGVQIKHAGNGREVRLRENILVDGYCEATNTVYNFHGCYFHGCELCYPDQMAELSGLKNERMFMRREATLATADRITSSGYRLVQIWECEFRRVLSRNPDANRFVSNHELIKSTPLNPRDAFFGGRTNAVRLYHHVEPEEEIKYLDVCSLYPFVNKYAKYPTGHPKVYVGDEECRQLPFDTIEGLIKATVLPPINLYHPVLPQKLHGKLMFILCKTCADALNQGECDHTPDERKFTGTYVADELRKAVEVGYQIVEFHEVWAYEISQYNAATKSGGLFSKYVDTFLKLKQQCSGYPAWCIDDATKERYIDEYLAKEGVALEKNKISFNAGLRYIAKLILNSFWGKLAQRENLNQTTILSEPYKLFKMMTDPSVEVQSLIAVDDDVIIVNWVRHEEGTVPLDSVNIALACYTTAFARLELYKYLEKLGRRVLYYDTDSVFFSQKPGEWCPPVGDFLGDMTDEVEKDYGVGSKIVEFVSGGPKNYAFKVVRSDTGEYVSVCKVKGITLNFKNSKTVNLETLKNMVLNDLQQTYVETDRKIVRTATYDVVSRPEKKIYRVRYNKRKREEHGYDTLPYGFKEL